MKPKEEDPVVEIRLDASAARTVAGGDTPATHILA
jgi:hypothetical protein